MYCHLIQSPSQMKKKGQSPERMHGQGRATETMLSDILDQDQGETNAESPIAQEGYEQDPAVNEGEAT